jgi:ElaB/YqjD/DUF883 family membrane-anchored ribosome-binding protein
VKEKNFMTNNPATGASNVSNKSDVGNGIDSKLATTAGNIGSSAGAAAAKASDLAHTAQEYGQKISDAAIQAKDFVGDKVGVVSDKIKELKDVNFSELAEDAKDFARQKPGQAILISAGVGLLLGLILRGRR